MSQVQRDLAAGAVFLLVAAFVALVLLVDTGDAEGAAEQASTPSTASLIHDPENDVWLVPTGELTKTDDGFGPIRDSIPGDVFDAHCEAVYLLVDGQHLKQ